MDLAIWKLANDLNSTLGFGLNGESGADNRRSMGHNSQADPLASQPGGSRAHSIVAHLEREVLRPGQEGNHNVSCASVLRSTFRRLLGDTKKVSRDAAFPKVDHPFMMKSAIHVKLRACSSGKFMENRDQTIRRDLGKKKVLRQAARLFDALFHQRNDSLDFGKLGDRGSRQL